MTRPFNEIFQDPLAWQAMDDLLDRGMCESLVYDLLLCIRSLPERYAELIKESPEEREKRRAKLAKKILALANEIETDREAKFLRIIDHKTLTASMQEYPTVSAFLRDVANEVENFSHYSDLWNSQLRGKKTTRNYFNQFARREIATVLLELLPKGGDRPLSAAAKLACVIGVKTTPKNMANVFGHLQK